MDRAFVDLEDDNSTKELVAAYQQFWKDFVRETEDAEKKGIEGTVDLRILVTEKGTVDEVEIAQSSGYTSMDEAAVRAAKRTRFRPAIKDGQRVAMWINYPIQFALTKKRN